jgi:hemolysin III
MLRAGCRSALSPDRAHNPPVTTPSRPSFRCSEHHAEWLTHALGLVLALAGAPVLIILAARSRAPAQIAACAIYSLSLILLFAASTCYHAFKGRRGEHHRLIADHIAIYLLIAGTYTALCFTVLRGPWGWSLAVIIWALAAVGTTLKLTTGVRHERLSLALYLLMGWLALVAIRPLLARTPTLALVLIGAGGLCYTLGVLFYARVGWCRIRYSHAIWHLAVIAGSASHYFAVRVCLLGAPV